MHTLEKRVRTVSEEPVWKRENGSKQETNLQSKMRWCPPRPSTGLSTASDADWEAAVNCPVKGKREETSTEQHQQGHCLSSARRFLPGTSAT